MKLADIRERCRVEDGHWIWVGAFSRGVPRIWAPDFSKGGKMSSQPGARAVWHVKTGKPIPAGWRVFATCEVDGCIAPQCIACQHPAERGAQIAATGVLKGSIRHRVNSRKTGRARSKLTPELIERIKTDPEKGYVLAQKLGISKSTVSKVRKHGVPAFEPVGGMFNGLLLAANDTGRRAA